MKKIFLFFSILLLILFVSCSNSKNMTTTIINGDVIYNGLEEREISFNTKDEISISLNKKEGSISIYVTSSDKKEYFYRSNDLPTSSFKVELKAGSYFIIIDADNFNGSYSIE